MVKHVFTGRILGVILHVEMGDALILISCTLDETADEAHF